MNGLQPSEVDVTAVNHPNIDETYAGHSTRTPTPEDNRCCVHQNLDVQG